MNNEPRQARQKTTKDMAFAAFLLMNGLQVWRATETHGRRANEYAFTFDDPNDKWEDLARLFANSESLRFDNSVRTLKKFCKRNELMG